MPTPQLLCPSGEAAGRLRRSLKLNQIEFWARVGITQSGGSRYESGRTMPQQVAWALHLSYGTAEQANDLVAWLSKRPDIPGPTSA